jgi:hypothetical protein
MPFHYDRAAKVEFDSAARGLSLYPPKFVHALSIRIQPIRLMHENRRDQKYRGGPVAFHLCSSAYLFVYSTSLSIILLVKDRLNIANRSFRSSVGGRFKVPWSSNR